MFPNSGCLRTKLKMTQNLRSPRRTLSKTSRHAFSPRDPVSSTKIKRARLLHRPRKSALLHLGRVPRALDLIPSKPYTPPLSVQAARPRRKAGPSFSRYTDNKSRLKSINLSRTPRLETELGLPLDFWPRTLTVGSHT